MDFQSGIGIWCKWICGTSNDKSVIVPNSHNVLYYPQVWHTAEKQRLTKKSSFRSLNNSKTTTALECKISDP